MANKVAITTDTGCDLSFDIIKKYHIADMIPLYINFPTESLRDRYDCTPEDIFKCFNDTKSVPKTAAPPIGEYLDRFSALSEQGYDIVNIAINSVFSSAYSNSLNAAEEVMEKYGNKIYTIDSLTLTGQQALLAIRAAELADSGMDAKSIYDTICELKSKTQTDFLLGGMDFAARGGRCSMLVAFGANLLKLYPMMHISHEGVISSPRKFRGSIQNVHKQYIDYMLSIADKADYSRAVINYTGMDKTLLDAMIKSVTNYGKFDDIIISQTNCTVATHGGPNTIAISFLNK